MENDLNEIVAIKQLLSESINLKHCDYIKKIIDKNVEDCNLLYTQVCYLIKLFLLNDYESNNKYNDYKFDEKFIRHCFKLIRTNGKKSEKRKSKKSNGKNNNNNNNIYERIHNFFVKFNESKNDDFKFTCPYDINSTTHITNALSRDIQTNISNNIITNFYKYVKEYIKINLKIDMNIKNDISKLQYSKIVASIFNDIINNTYYSDLSYHDWINKHKKLLVPKIDKNIFITSLQDGLKNHKNLFIQHLNKYLKNNDELKFLINFNNEKKITNLLKSISNDIVENTKINVKYQDWIDLNLNKIVNTFNESNCVDMDKYLNDNPYNFIPNMLFINKNLELNKSKKTYQVIPLRTNMTPKFIPINVHSFVDLLDPSYLFNKIKNYYHNNTKKGIVLFETYFNFTSKFIERIKEKGYIFSGLIHTNGYEIVFIFNTKSYQEKKDKFHSSGKKEKKFINNSIKNLTEDEMEKFLINNTENKKAKKKENDELLNEKRKKDKDNEKNENKKKLNNVKNDIDALNLKYDNDLNNLINEHYESLNNELNKIDKTKIENKEKMKLIVDKLKDKLESDKSFLFHCYKRNYDTCIDDYESCFNSNYNDAIKKSEENDKKILSVKKTIKLKKNELNKLKKECKYVSNDENEIKNIKNLKNINKQLNNVALLHKTIKRQLNKIKLNIEMLNYEINDKTEYKKHIDSIKLKLISLIEKIYASQNFDTLNNHVNLITNNNIGNLKNVILEKSILETKNFFDLCIKYTSCDMVNNNNKLSNDKILKILTNGIIEIEKEKNKTDDYKKKYKNLIDELENLTKELNKLIKEKNNNDNKLMNLYKTKSNDYMQIDYMSKKMLEVLNKMNWVVIDPGMNSILTMMSKDEKKTYSYTKQHHLNRTNRNKILKKIEKIKKNKINKLEKQLTKDNKRLRSSNDYLNFKSYFNMKMKLHNNLVKMYNDNKLNKLKWHSFINEKRSEKMLVNDIKKKFGNDVVLILGNWSMNKEGIKTISTPNKKYERILKKNFITLKINEFRTSIMHNKTEKKCENYVKKHDVKKLNIKSIYHLNKLEKNNEEKYKKVIEDKKIHKILVCKTNEKLNEYVNRDKNSVKNMIKIMKSYITENHKPKTFVMGTKICNDTLCIM